MYIYIYTHSQTKFHAKGAVQCKCTHAFFLSVTGLVQHGFAAGNSGPAYACAYFAHLAIHVFQIAIH